MNTLALVAEQLCHQQKHSHWKNVHSVGLGLKSLCRFTEIIIRQEKYGLSPLAKD
jgi:hypothetical protein